MYSLSTSLSLSKLPTQKIMEECGKAPESDITSEFKRELHAWPAILDDECGVDFSPEVPIKEELVEEVMQELWKEISCSCSDTDPPSTPASFPANPQSFLVAGGYQESCGPSFSDLSSTVMAGIEMGGVRVIGEGVSPYVGTTGKCACGNVCSPASAGDGPWVAEEIKGCDVWGGEGMGEKMDGCDGEEADDEWLTRVLSWGPQEVDEWL